MMCEDTVPVKKQPTQNPLWVIYQHPSTLNEDIPHILLEVIKVEHMNLKDLTFTKKDSDEIFQTYRIKDICVPGQDTKPNPSFDEERIMKEDTERLDWIQLPVHQMVETPIQHPKPKTLWDRFKRWLKRDLSGMGY